MIADIALMGTIVLVFVGVFGTLIGSFANVVIYRVPAGISVVAPRSACPGCGTPIRALDNIPLLSWIALRGRCRDCREPISARYPLVESAVGVLFVVVALWRWPSIADDHSTAAIVGELLTLAAFLYLAAISVVLAMIDIDTRTLPNAIVLPAYVVGALLLGLSAILTDNIPGLLSAVIGGGAAFAFYLLLAVVYPGGMGFGDVKLAGVIGLFLGYLGWAPLVVGVFAAFILGGIFSVILVALHRAGRGSGIPFGPWMLGGLWIGALVGPTIGSAYLSLFGLG